MLFKQTTQQLNNQFDQFREDILSDFSVMKINSKQITLNFYDVRKQITSSFQ